MGGAKGEVIRTRNFITSINSSDKVVVLCKSRAHVANCTSEFPRAEMEQLEFAAETSGLCFMSCKKNRVIVR